MHKQFFFLILVIIIYMVDFKMTIFTPKSIQFVFLTKNDHFYTKMYSILKNLLKFKIIIIIIINN